MVWRYCQCSQLCYMYWHTVLSSCSTLILFPRSERDTSYFHLSLIVVLLKNRVGKQLYRLQTLQKHFSLSAGPRTQGSSCLISRVRVTTAPSLISYLCVSPANSLHWTKFRETGHIRRLSFGPFFRFCVTFENWPRIS